MSADLSKIIDRIRIRWEILRKSRRFRDSLLFLIFIAVATIFWIFLAMNDNVQRTFDITLKINNVPDSVTFINDPPEAIHVSVRDKGTTLFRSTIMHNHQIELNFKEFASNGHFKYSTTDLYSSVRSLFSPSALINSVSIDSLNLAYTKSPGKRVPLVIEADVEPSLENVISGPLKISTKSVLLYSMDVALDTISEVFTQRIVKRGLTETTSLSVGVKPIRGVKIIPSEIMVTIPVEPLVKKQSLVDIEVYNVPKGESVLLFPAKVEVTYFLPMSKFNDPVEGIHVVADYAAAISNHSKKMNVRIFEVPAGYKNVTIPHDSVEFTIVK